MWEPVLWAASILRHPQLHLRLQGRGGGQDPQGKPSGGRRQDPENIKKPLYLSYVSARLSLATRYGERWEL